MSKRAAKKSLTSAIGAALIPNPHGCPPSSLPPVPPLAPTNKVPQTKELTPPLCLVLPVCNWRHYRICQGWQPKEPDQRNGCSTYLTLLPALLINLPQTSPSLETPLTPPTLPNPHHPMRSPFLLPFFRFAVGGTIAFVKAGSQKSLTSAMGAALILTLSGRKMLLGSARGSIAVCLAISVFLSIIMAGRYSRSRKVMPAGMTAAASIGMSAAYIFSLIA